MRGMLVLLAIAQAGAQPVALSVEGPVFEASTLKKVVEDHNRSNLTGGPGTSSPTRVRMHSTVHALLWEAFGVSSYELVNTGKVPLDIYEFAAVLPAGATKDEYRAMLRNLLVDRFQFRYHRETRDLPLYELRLAPGRPKLKPTANEAPATDDLGDRATPTPDGYMAFPPGINTSFYGNHSKFTVQRVHTTMDEFATALEKEWMQNPVVNRTGLTERYDFILRFDARRDPGVADDTVGPPLEQALRNQLGLALHQGKGPHEVIVIDSFDRESARN
jgi:uncharacterized protein (TIGR03435 family)